MSDETTLSISEAARQAGISRAALRKHLKIGRIQCDGSRVNTASFSEWLQDRTNKDSDDPSVIVQHMEETLKKNVFTTLKEANLYKTSYEARLKQLEYDLKSGLVVSIEDVASAVGNEYARIRTRLLSLAAEQAPQLFNCRNVPELQDRLQALIYRILTELTKDDCWTNTLSERIQEPNKSTHQNASPQSDSTAAFKP